MRSRSRVREGPGRRLGQNMAKEADLLSQLQGDDKTLDGDKLHD